MKRRLSPVIVLTLTQVGLVPVVMAADDTVKEPAATAPVSSEPNVSTQAPLNTLTIRATADKPKEISAIQKITISQAEMLRYGDTSVEDSLRRAAGIQMGSSGGPNKAKFRGGGAPTILINGEAVQGGRRAASSLIDTFTPDMLDRIEVTKQASVTQGSVAAGGVINIILKDPRNSKLGGVIKVGYGDNQRDKQSSNQQQTNLQLDGRQGKFGYSLSANDRQSERTAITELTRVDSHGDRLTTEQTRQSDGGFRMISPRLEYEWSKDNKGFADIFYGEHRNESQSSSEYQQKDSDNLRLNVRLEQKHGDREDKWRVSGQWENEQQTTQSSSANLIPYIDETSNEYKVSYAGSQKFGDSHQLKFGIETEQERLRSNIEPTLTEQSQALYLEENWKISDQHTVTAGLRQEWLKRSGLIDYSDDSLSPALAYRYQIDPSNPAWTIQVGYSQSQRTPRTNDLSPTVSLSTSADAGSLNNPDKGGNPALRSESIQALESTLGYNSPDGGFNLTVFRRDISDYIERVVALEADRYVERPQNQSQALATGVELEGRWAFKRTGGHSLMLNGQLSTIRAEVQQSGQADRLANDVAPYTTSLGLSYQYQPWRWSSNLNIGYQPSYTRQLDDQPYTRHQNARTNLDISTTKRFDQGWAMTVSARNLLATDQIEQLTDENGELYQRRQAESVPNILLTVEKRF